MLKKVNSRKRINEKSKDKLIARPMIWGMAQWCQMLLNVTERTSAIPHKMSQMKVYS